MVKAKFAPITVAGDDRRQPDHNNRPPFGRTVMRRMPFGAVCLAALVAAGIPAAVAGPPTKTTLSFDVIMFDQCSGEDVELTGSQTMSLAFSVNANTFHASIYISSHLDGVGLSTGARYRSNLEDQFESNGSFAGFPLELKVLSNVNFIGQGAVANERVKIANRLTINGNGTITVNRDSIELTCQGNLPLLPP